VGGVLLVVGVQKTRHQDVEKSLSALSMVGSNVLGIVLNRLPVKGPDAYSYSYYGSDQPKATFTSRRRTRGSDNPYPESKRPGNYSPSEFDRTLVDSDPQPAKTFRSSRFDQL
jgi:Mrp family chromosome partitioning ATPase